MAVHLTLSLHFIILCLFSPGLSGLFDEYSCYSRLDVCRLKDVALESDRAIELSTFRDIRDPLVIESGTIPKFSQALWKKIPSVLDVTVDRIGIVQLFIRPGLLHLSAVGNAIDKVLLDETKNSEYSMLTLHLSNNQLTELPPLERFVRLMTLAVDNNLLSSIDMGAFSKLTNLRVLSLAHNRLLTVTSPADTPLQLIKLRRLSFAGNQLAMLDIRTWEFDSLEDLNVTSNSLTRFDGSLTQFPVLKRLDLAHNRWYCEWLMMLYTHEDAAFGLKLDADEPGRCRDENMMVPRHHCCNPAGADGSGLIDIFGDKWDELKRLALLLDKINATIANGSASVNRVLNVQHEALSGRVAKLTEAQKEQTVQLRELEQGINHQKEKLRNLETELKEKVNRLTQEVNAHWNQTDAGSDEQLMNFTATLATAPTNWSMLAVQNQNNLSQLQKLFVTTSKQFNSYSDKSYEQEALLKAQSVRIDNVQQELNEVRRSEKLIQQQLETLEPDANRILSFLTEIRKGCVDDEEEHVESYE
uniref:Leucine-rich immune protein (Short) n=1 Tax=Anopheles funestus TaxID=62324 RepID=A0A3F2YXM7_ANOFN